MFAALLEAVSPERRARALKFLRPIDAVRSLFAELLLREVIAERAAISRDAVTFGVDHNGKPCLASDSGFQFNLSHSGDWVACATGSHVVGVDVERVRDRPPDILDRVLSGPERVQFDGLPEPQQPRFFFTRWAVKEAFSKALGLGVGLPFHELLLSVQRSGAIRFVRGQQPVADAIGRILHLDTGHAAAVCVIGGEAPATVQIWEARAIIDRVMSRFPTDPS